MVELILSFRAAALTRPPVHRKKLYPEQPPNKLTLSGPQGPEVGPPQHRAVRRFWGEPGVALNRVSMRLMGGKATFIY